MIAIVLAWSSRSSWCRSRDGRDHGKRLAIGALCVCGVWLLVIAGLIAHEGEVFTTFDLDGEHTNQGEVDRLSDARCLDRFEGFVGIPPRRSSLRLQVFRPISEV